MGNGYKSHHHCGRSLNSQRLSSTPLLLPMLCSRSSFKDVKWEGDRSDSSCDNEDDPLSPEVGCMGQVKRNNRVVGFPTSNSRLSIAAAGRSRHNNYSNLKRLFSAKSLTSAATTSTAPAVSSCRVAGRAVQAAMSKGSSCEKEKVGPVSTVSVVDMDPPLPVIRKVRKDDNAGDSDGDRDKDSLWKRRSGGIGLKNLELEKIDHPRHHMQPVTV